MSLSSEDLRLGALYYHREPKPGKLEIYPTKPLSNQRDLALAYSPGVAAACQAIEEDPAQVDLLTIKANLVAVITNGTAVLGLGAIGPLSAKPVMEGKAVLFKKFANIDVFDLEINETDPDKFCDIVAALEPTFGGINLEDIKAPECFEIEEALKKRMNIPVFHDDQHGTAIIVGAAVLNALELSGKEISRVKLVTSGAGAAAIACLNLLVSLGLKKENIYVTDLEGVVYTGRPSLMDRWKSVYAQETSARTLAEVIEGADIFLGLSAGGVLRPDLLEKMAPYPLILALANPVPEIMPDVARKARPDAMVCTGRSDYPNQVNNVLCFPFIFRGALDVGATTINEEMKLAAVRAIAQLAHEPSSDIAAAAYEGETPLFGPNFIIPTPFDPRLVLRIPPAVAKAAMETGVAKRPIRDFNAYEEHLSRFVFRSGFLMRPLFIQARRNPKRIVFAEGEDERVMRAAAAAVQDKIAQPILIGRPDIIEQRLKKFGLTIRPKHDFEIINPYDDPRYRDYVDTLLRCAGRRGISPEAARTLMRTSFTVIASVAVRRGDADAMICGLEGRFYRHLSHIRDIIGLAPEVRDFATVSVAILNRGFYFFADTYGNKDRDAVGIAALARQVAGVVRRFGVEPKVALLANSSFGSAIYEGATRMREATEILYREGTDFEVDGEMHGNAALNQELRDRLYPWSLLKGEANTFIMPNSDAANLAFQLVMELAEGISVGPILVGAALPAHIMVPAATTRSVVNMMTLACVEAQSSLRARFL